MEDDAFEQVSERDVLLFGDSFEYFQEALFEAYASLNAFDFDGWAVLLFG
jgi:hypothetical protein